MWWFFGWWMWWGRRAKNTNGEDIKIAINITFEESYLWTTKKIAYDRLTKVKWSEEKKCEACNGRWAVTQQAHTPFGVMQTQVVCPKCWWTGHTYTKDGKKLENWWLEKNRETIEIKIPEWIKEWSYIKYANRWHEDSNNTSWDLYIRIDIQKSKIYERKWDNLYTSVDVSLFDMVLWWEVSANHPSGKIKVKIPKGTQIGDMIKIWSKWFWHGWMFAKKWDMFLIPKVDIPKKLSKEQEKLRNELKNC
jgi:molecular chaperone DnaJ